MKISLRCILSIAILLQVTGEQMLQREEVDLISICVCFQLKQEPQTGQLPQRLKLKMVKTLYVQKKKKIYNCN